MQDRSHIQNELSDEQTLLDENRRDLYDSATALICSNEDLAACKAQLAACKHQSDAQKVVADKVLSEVEIERTSLKQEFKNELNEITRQMIELAAERDMVCAERDALNTTLQDLQSAWHEARGLLENTENAVVGTQKSLAETQHLLEQCENDLYNNAQKSEEMLMLKEEELRVVQQAHSDCREKLSVHLEISRDTVNAQMHAQQDHNLERLSVMDAKVEEVTSLCFEIGDAWAKKSKYFEVALAKAQTKISSTRQNDEDEQSLHYQMRTLQTELHDAKKKEQETQAHSLLLASALECELHSLRSGGALEIGHILSLLEDLLEAVSDATMQLEGLRTEQMLSQHVATVQVQTAATAAQKTAFHALQPSPSAASRPSLDCVNLTALPSVPSISLEIEGGGAQVGVGRPEPLGVVLVRTPPLARPRQPLPTVTSTLSQHAPFSPHTPVAQSRRPVMTWPRTPECVSKPLPVGSDGASAAVHGHSGIPAPETEPPQWGCEWDCGFKGDYEAVSLHEKQCSLNTQICRESFTSAVDPIMPTPQLPRREAPRDLDVMVELVLDLHLPDIIDTCHTTSEHGEQDFKDEVALQVSRALEGMGSQPDKMHILGIRPGSIILQIGLEADVCSTGRAALDVARELKRQALDAASALRMGRYTAAVCAVNVWRKDRASPSSLQALDQREGVDQKEEEKREAERCEQREALREVKLQEIIVQQTEKEEDVEKGSRHEDEKEKGRQMHTQETAKKRDEMQMRAQTTHLQAKILLTSFVEIRQRRLFQRVLQHWYLRSYIHMQQAHVQNATAALWLRSHKTKRSLLLTWYQHARESWCEQRQMTATAAFAMARKWTRVRKMWASWREIYHTKATLLCGATRVTSRVRRSILRRMLGRWIEIHDTNARLLNAARRVDCRTTYSVLITCWVWWHQIVSTRTRLTNVSAKVAERVRHTALCLTWKLWKCAHAKKVQLMRIHLRITRSRRLQAIKLVLEKWHDKAMVERSRQQSINFQWKIVDLKMLASNFARWCAALAAIGSVIRIHDDVQANEGEEEEEMWDQQIHEADRSDIKRQMLRVVDLQTYVLLEEEVDSLSQMVCDVHSEMQSVYTQKLIPKLQSFSEINDSLHKQHTEERKRQSTEHECKDLENQTLSKRLQEQWQDMERARDEERERERDAERCAQEELNTVLGSFREEVRVERRARDREVDLSRTQLLAASTRLRQLEEVIEVQKQMLERAPISAPIPREGGSRSGEEGSKSCEDGGGEGGTLLFGREVGHTANTGMEIETQEVEKEEADQGKWGIKALEDALKQLEEALLERNLLTDTLANVSCECQRLTGQAAEYVEQVFCVCSICAWCLRMCPCVLLRNVCLECAHFHGNRMWPTIIFEFVPKQEEIKIRKL